MERGELVPDDMTIADAPRSARPARRAARRDPRRLPADARPRRRRSTTPSRAAGRSVDAALSSTFPPRSSSRRLRGRWICRARGPRLQQRHEPAAGRRASATSTARRSSSGADDVPRRRPGPARRRSSPRSHEVVDHYRDARRPAARSTAASRSRTSARDLLAAPCRRRLPAAGLSMVTRKSRREIEQDAPRRPDRRRGPRARRVRAASPACPPAISIGSPRSTSATPARCRRSRATATAPPVPGQLCISIDDEVVHGIPGERTIRDGPGRVVDAGAISTAGTATRARTFVVGEPAAAGSARARRHDPRGDDGRHRRGGARAPTSATSPRPSRTSRRRTATASSASTSATASGPRCTRSRRSPTTGPASRA